MFSSSVIQIRHLFQTNVFARPLGILQAMENFEELGFRLPYVNFVLNHFPACDSVVKPKTKKIPPNKCHCKHTCFVHLCFILYVIKLKISFIWNVYVCPDLIHIHREHVCNIFKIVGEDFKFGIFLNYNNGRCEHKSVQFHVLLDID